MSSGLVSDVVVVPSVMSSAVSGVEDNAIA